MTRCASSLGTGDFPLDSIKRKGDLRSRVLRDKICFQHGIEILFAFSLRKIH